MLIATRGFCARQNPYGFRAFWSWKNISTDFSILRDLLRNWFLGKIKLCSFFPGQELTYIKNCFSTIEVLPIGFHLPQTERYDVKTLMGVKRFEVHFRVIFLTDHKVAPNREKIANASHDDIYVIICVKIKSEGRRQELGRTSAGKIHLICRRLSEKNHLNFLGWTSAGKKNLGRTSAGFFEWS